MRTYETKTKQMFKINKYANKIYLEDGLYRYITPEDLLEMRYNVFHGSSSKVKEFFQDLENTNWK